MKEALIPVGVLVLIFFFIHPIKSHWTKNALFISANLDKSCILHKKRKKTAIILTITALIIILLFDQFNVLTNYEKWINRGMPSRFELTPYIYEK